MLWRMYLMETNYSAVNFGVFVVILLIFGCINLLCYKLLSETCNQCEQLNYYWDDYCSHCGTQLRITDGNK